MMFRKLYWVTEQVDNKGLSNVTGVYTSIPNLIRQGLPQPEADCQVRLSLTKLDSEDPVLGTWLSPEFASIGEDLMEFVKTDEINEEQRQSLVRALHAHQKMSV